MQKAGATSDLQFIKNRKSYTKIRFLERVSVNKTIGGILTKASNLIGLKGEIQPQYKSDIIDLIHSRYNGLSLEELDKAFTIDRHSPEPVQHFNLLNSTYVSKVINNYLEWKLNIIKQNNLNKKENKDLKLSPEQIKENRIQFLKNIFQDIKNRGFCRDAYHLYDDVDAPNKNNDDYKKKVYNKVLARNYKNEKTNRTFKGAFEEYLKDVSTKNEYHIRQAKSILVSEYLKDFVKDFETFKSKIKNR